MQTNSLTVPCLICKQPVELKQPKGHTDYCPYGKCHNCGLYHYATYNSAGELIVSSFREEEHA